MPLSPLARGRVISIVGVLLLCWDTPTYRLLRVRLPSEHPRFGFAVCVWRGFSAAVACCFFALALDGWSVAKLRVSVAALGAPKLLGGAALMAISSLTFTVAVALTSAANVLVIIALGPLITALLSRAFLRTQLATHTWAACVAGFLAVALVFAGSMQGGQTLGCVLAAGCPLFFGSYLVLSACVPRLRAPRCFNGATLTCRRRAARLRAPHQCCRTQP